MVPFGKSNSYPSQSDRRMQKSFPLRKTSVSFFISLQIKHSFQFWYNRCYCSYANLLIVTVKQSRWTQMHEMAGRKFSCPSRQYKKQGNKKNISKLFTPQWGKLWLYILWPNTGLSCHLISQIFTLFWLCFSLNYRERMQMLLFPFDFAEISCPLIV